MTTLVDLATPLYNGSLARRQIWPSGLVIGISRSRAELYHYRDGKPDLTYFMNQEDQLAEDWELVKAEDYVKEWNMKP